MSFGGQTVGIVTLVDSAERGYLGMPTSSARTIILRHNVHFRPVSVDETQGQTNVATEVWKLTDFPDVAPAAKSTGIVLFDGTPNPADVEANRFQIDGPAVVKHDFQGPHHVTIMCKRQVM